MCKTEPGDENNQDISSLVGKVDIRRLEMLAQNDADAYSYSGGLNRANQGLLEFVEMFKAPIKMLHPLLTATQEGNYIGTENIGAIPFSGIILAHSNEAEWQSFKTNKNNEAFIDRIYVIKVPYCLRVTEEQKIYDKLVSKSELATAPCAPATLEMLARFSVLTRLRKHENSTTFSKMRVYDGESLKDTDPHAKTIQEYRDAAGINEGIAKLLQQAFSNADLVKVRFTADREAMETQMQELARLTRRDEVFGEAAVVLQLGRRLRDREAGVVRHHTPPRSGPPPAACHQQDGPRCRTHGAVGIRIRDDRRNLACCGGRVSYRRRRDISRRRGPVSMGTRLAALPGVRTRDNGCHRSGYPGGRNAGADPDARAQGIPERRHRGGCGSL